MLCSEGRFALGGLAALAIWLFVILPWLYGPPPRFAEPSGPKQTHSANGYQQATTEPDHAAPVPIPVQVISAKKSAHEADEERREREQKASNEWWLMAWTAILAAFTALLACVAGVQAALFLVQMRSESAKAQVELAKAQIDVMRIGIFDLERAFIDLSPTNIVTRNVKGPSYGGLAKKEVVVTLMLHNTGRTACNVRIVYGEFAKELPPGEKPVYNFEPTVVDLGLAAGQRGALHPIEFVTDFSEQYFWGYIEYVDVFKNRHTARYCTYIVPSIDMDVSGKFQLAGADAWRECD